MTHRIMRSARGIEEGTYFSDYSAMGYGYINQKVFPWTAREVARARKTKATKHAVGIPFLRRRHQYQRRQDTKGTDGFSVPVREGLPVLTCT